MKCPKCNKECFDNFCSRCKIILEENSLVKLKENIHEHDLDIFIGNNSEKIIYRNFNLPAALFNFLYYSYRKCYVFSFILFIIETFSYYYWINILNNNFIFLFLANILFFSTFGNSIYLAFAKKKIKKIENLDNFKDVLIIKGGTNLVSPFVFILIIAIFALIITKLG